MIIGMTRKAKIAVTVPEWLVDAMRRAVAAGEAASVSAYVTAALEDKIAEEDFGSYLDQLLEENGGPVTDAERARYKEEFG